MSKMSWVLVVALGACAAGGDATDTNETDGSVADDTDAGGADGPADDTDEVASDDTDVAADTDDSDAPADTDVDALTVADVAGYFARSSSPTDTCQSQLDTSLATLAQEGNEVALYFGARRMTCVVAATTADRVDVSCGTIVYTRDMDLGGSNFCLAEYAISATAQATASGLVTNVVVMRGGGCATCNGSFAVTYDEISPP